ncbi:MAG: hypothetical protein J6V24_07575, partial [Clostridia bacterium]|nr:hypothetical protein [Clostridia bacterium]
MYEHVLKIMQSCPCGRRHALLTEECVVAPDAEEQMKEYIARKGWHSPLVIADENTEKFISRLGPTLD